MAASRGPRPLGWRLRTLTWESVPGKRWNKHEHSILDFRALSVTMTLAQNQCQSIRNRHLHRCIVGWVCPLAMGLGISLWMHWSMVPSSGAALFGLTAGPFGETSSEHGRGKLEPLGETSATPQYLSLIILLTDCWSEMCFNAMCSYPRVPRIPSRFACSCHHRVWWIPMKPQRFPHLSACACACRGFPSRATLSSSFRAVMLHSFDAMGNLGTRLLCWCHDNAAICRACSIQWGVLSNHWKDCWELRSRALGSFWHIMWLTQGSPMAMVSMEVLPYNCLSSCTLSMKKSPEKQPS